jgi:hypothetical protein
MASGKANNNSIGFLSIIFQVVVSADYATLVLNATSSPATNLYVSLHTANPGASGNQTTSEAGYTSYARVAVARTNSGWGLTAETIANLGVITFPTATGGSETETYVGVGLSSSGAGVLLWFGSLTTPLAVSNGITPAFAIGQLAVTES